MPFFNRSNNEDLILAIQSAGVSRGRNGLFLRYATKALHDNRKDKSGEKLAESEGYFVVDTLYIGADKFPYHDSFALSVSGVS